MFWNVRLFCVDIKIIPGPDITSVGDDIGPNYRHIVIVTGRHPIHAKSILIHWLLIYSSRITTDINRAMFIPTINEQEQRIRVEEEDNIDNKVVETIEAGKVIIREEEEVIKGKEYKE